MNSKEKCFQPVYIRQVIQPISLKRRSEKAPVRGPFYAAW